MTKTTDQVNSSPATTHAEIDYKKENLSTWLKTLTIKIYQRQGLPKKQDIKNIPETSIWDKSTELEILWDDLAYKRAKYYQARRRKVTPYFITLSLLNIIILILSYNNKLPENTITSTFQILTSLSVLITFFTSSILPGNNLVTDPYTYLKINNQELLSKTKSLIGKKPLPPYDQHWLIPNKAYTDQTAIKALAGFASIDQFEKIPAHWIRDNDKDNIELWSTLGYIKWLSKQGLNPNQEEIFKSLKPSYQGSLSELIEVSKSI